MTSSSDTGAREGAAPSAPPSPLAEAAGGGAACGSSVSIGVVGGSAGLGLPREAAAAAVEAEAVAAAAGEAAATPMASVGEAVVTGALVARGGVLAVAVDAAVALGPRRALLGDGDWDPS